MLGGGPKQGQKFYIKNCSGCCPENVPVPGQRWGTSLGAGGKAQGGHVPSCGFTVLATGSGWGGGSHVGGCRPWVCGCHRLLDTVSLPFAFWRHDLEICHAELGARGLPGCEAPEASCAVFLQHTHLRLVSRGAGAPGL